LKCVAGAEVLAGEQGLGKALLYIVSTGDRVIQTLLENQVSAILYRVAALFPEHFQSFTMAFQFIFLNNSFGMHCLSYIQKQNQKQTDIFQEI
jgi:hypothetical protein